MENKNLFLVGNDEGVLSSKTKTAILPFCIAVIFLIALCVFDVLMIKLNLNYLKTYSEEMNFFRIVSWLLSGRLGLMLTISWLISIFQTAFFSWSATSEISAISIISKIMIVVSLLTLAVPVVAIIIIL